MAKKEVDVENLMEDVEEETPLGFEDTEELDFSGEDDLLLDEEGEDEIIPSVLYKGASRPKTEDDWRQRLLESKHEGTPAYQISDMYREGDLIQHAKFGLGVVSKVVSNQKMEVVFDHSKKLLAMNLPPRA